MKGWPGRGSPVASNDRMFLSSAFDVRDTDDSRVQKITLDASELDIYRAAGKIYLSL